MDDIEVEWMKWMGNGERESIGAECLAGLSKSNNSWGN